MNAKNLKVIMELNNWNEEEITRGKKAFMNMARHLMPHFKVDNRNKDIVNDLFYYFHKIEGGRLDTTKGLWLEGEVGTGKSSLMNIFSNHLRRYWNGNGFKMYTCSTISVEFATNPARDVEAADLLDRYTYNKNGYIPYNRVSICFDELGRETIPSARYAFKVNVMEHILHLRYTFWQNEGLLTYVTTNLDANKVEDLYGDYIRDRRAEMFNIIAMTGESRRK